MCMEAYEGKKAFKSTRGGLKKIFRLGGKLREMQLYENWFRQNGLLRFARQIELVRKVTGKDEAFTQRVDDYFKWIKDEEKLLLSQARKRSQKEVYCFYLDLLEGTLDKLCRKDPDNWHRQRKKCKRVLYARHWQDSPGLQILSKKQAIYLDRLQHLIGFWHDNEEMIKWIREQKSIYEKKSAVNREEVSEGFRKATQILELKSGHYRKNLDYKLSRCDQVLAPTASRLKKEKAHCN
jgi:hypothetical protein